MPEPNPDKLVTWCDSSLDARQTAITLSTQDEESTEIRTDDILGDIDRRGGTPHRRNVTAALRALESLGFGRIVAGRRGNTGSRFVSVIGLKALGTAALGGKSAEQETNTILHRLTVRPGIEVSLKMPADLTPAEANRLANLIKLLPFETDGN